jgi:hypothetical protein
MAMPMTNARARQLALQAMTREIKALAVDANLHERFGLAAPHAVEASKRREAVRVLSGPQQVSMKLR